MVTNGREIVHWLCSPREIPLPVKLLYTLFVFIVVPTYWHAYGPTTFLWVSDLALLLGLVALWLENRLLASMQAVSALIVELGWSIEYLLQLTTGVKVTGMAEYMFNSGQSSFVSALSLFHIPLPFFLLWLVYRLGYDSRAWIAQTIFSWMVLLVCFFFTKPSDNINWAFGLKGEPQHAIAPALYLAIFMLLVPVCLFLPVHLLLKAFMSKGGRHNRGR